LKTPICSFDAKTGVLCAGCEAKLESGLLTPTDIEIAIKLTKLAEREEAVNTLSLISAAKLGVDSVLFFRGSDIVFLRSNPELLKKLESEFGGAVWFVEAKATDRKFIENLFFPSKVVSINFFWLPDGKKLTKVLVEGKDSKIASKATKIQDIAKELRNVELIIEYET
jgi:transcription antitermination factor NusA-like protein